MKSDDATYRWCTNFFNQQPTNRILVTLGVHTTVKIKIILQFLYTLNKVNIALKTDRRSITSFITKFFKTVHTVKVSVTVIPQLGNDPCAVFFIF